MKVKLIIFIYFFLAASLFAQIGEIVYIEGDVSLIRNQQEITGYDIDFGDPIENYDLIVTEDGYVEIETFASTGISSVISVQPYTSFSFEISDMLQEQQGTLEILAGEVSLRVARLQGNNGLSLRTSSVVMGVRGTEFSVTAGIDGAVLVTCSTGSVECSSSTGDTFFCEPGRVVSAEESGMLSQIPVAVSSLDSFKENWIRERLTALEADLGRAFPNFVYRYTDLYQEFRLEFNQLINSNADILQKWISEDQAGSIGSRMDVMREKREVIGDLMDVRRVMVIFERVYYRMLQFQDYLQESGQLVTLEPGYNSNDFYRDFNQNAVELTKRMNEYRYIVKLYSARNGGEFPLDAFTSAGSSEDDFFGDTGNFFD